MKKMTVGLMLCLVSAFGSGCLLVNSDDDKDDARRNVDRGSKVDYCDAVATADMGLRPGVCEIGRVPGAFRHRIHGPTDLVIMHRELCCRAAASAWSRSSPWWGAPMVPPPRRRSTLARSRRMPRSSGWSTVTRSS